ncbi:hypothetical protein NE237_006924 [Protea cynaroides]|uniref:Uncharacterized protein n=1 Tax=Protea cynaroides TaxID=273540 RepID=A0A9Q0QVM0_9MAGN|nr:hypothetical protein NE237_006924 [Protea cynaroides]
MLLTKEIHLMAENPSVDVHDPSAHYTTSNDSHGGPDPCSRYNRGRNAPSRFYHIATPPGSYSGNAHSGHSSSNVPDYCPICNRIGYKALDCRKRFNPTYSSGFTSNTSDHYSEDQNQSNPDNVWLSDSGATNHITAELKNLHSSNPYSGTEHCN